MIDGYRCRTATLLGKTAPPTPIMQTLDKTQAKFAQLAAHLREITDIESASSLLHWDQATYMPAKGASARGRQLASSQTNIPRKIYRSKNWRTPRRLAFLRTNPPLRLD